MRVAQHLAALRAEVSVLFNEPKLLKWIEKDADNTEIGSFSALQRAEIAEIVPFTAARSRNRPFQCSSTSRNC